MRHRAIRILAAGCVLGLAAPGPAGTRTPQPAAADRPRAEAAIPGSSSLAIAFEFASAIRTDPKDRARAQSNIAGDLATEGAVDEALRRAASIGGWRRGAVLADLADRLARAGRAAEARKLIGEADGIAEAAEGWHRLRVLALVAEAHAALGDVEAAERIGRDIAAADPRQFTARGAAAIAAAHAARGEFREALDGLRRLDPLDDFDSTWWRTAAYLDLAGRSAAPADVVSTALQAAEESAAAVPGWKRGAALLNVAEARLDHGDRNAAHRTAKAVEPIANALPDGAPAKVSLLQDLARFRGRMGDREGARALLSRARSLVPHAISIERPGALAAIASGFGGLGDETRAAELYGLALDQAASLVNSRPRALAVVDICRSMAREGRDPDANQKERLDALLAGLGEPW